MSECAIELKNISKSYMDGLEEKVILDDISLSVRKGEFVAIVGPSGSGKSTLLSIAGMMLSPDKGQVIISGEDVSNKKQKEWTKLRCKHIGFIFQNHQLLPYLTAEEQLTLLANNKDVDALGLLEQMGLSDSKKKYPSKMSGGEKQRVAIARAFVNNPDVILADEPTASLDGERGRSIVEIISKEVKRQHKAAIMVTHDERVLDLVDKVYRLDKGMLVTF